MKKGSKKSTKSTKTNKTTTASTKKVAKTAKASSKKVAKTTTIGKKRGRPRKIDLVAGDKKNSKPVVVNSPSPKKRTTRKKVNTLDDITPVEASLDESYATVIRRNKSASIERTNRFTNIQDGLVPFKWSSASYNSTQSNVTVKDAVILCQKTYYNFAIFRNTIDLMTEFSSSTIFFRGGNKKSKRFFEAFFKKIGLWGGANYKDEEGVFIFNIDWLNDFVDNIGN